MSVNVNGYTGNSLVGEIFVSDTPEMNSHKEGKSPWKKIQFGVNDGTSTIYVEQSNSKYDNVKYKVGENEVTIARGNGEVTESEDPNLLLLKQETDNFANLGYNYKRFLKLGPTRSEDGTITYAIDKVFIDNYDYVAIIAKNIQALKGRRVHVTGNIGYDDYEGNLKTVFSFQSIRELLEDEEVEQDVDLQLEMPFVSTINSLSKADFSFETLAKKAMLDRVITYNVFVPRYDKPLGRNMLFPATLTVDLTHLDFSEEAKTATETILAAYYKILNMDNSKKELKKDKYYMGIAIVEYFSAKSKIELDEQEKLMVQMGWAEERALIKEKLDAVKGAKQTMLKFKRFKAGGTLVYNKDIKAAEDHWVFEKDDATTTTKQEEPKVEKKEVAQPEQPKVEKAVGLDALNNGNNGAASITTMFKL